MSQSIHLYNTKSYYALILSSKKIQEKPLTFFKDFKRKPIDPNTKAQPYHKKILPCTKQRRILLQQKCCYYFAVASQAFKAFISFC